MAVDSVVLGPGVKLAAVASTNKAVSSVGFMVAGCAALSSQAKRLWFLWRRWLLQLIWQM